MEDKENNKVMLTANPEQEVTGNNNTDEKHNLFLVYYQEAKGEHNKSMRSWLKKLYHLLSCWFQDQT